MIQMFNSPSIGRAPSGAASGVKITGGAVVLMSGQVAWNSEGEVVGEGDIETQTRVAFDNVRKVLELAGAKLEDVAKFNFYLTSLDQRSTVLKVRDEVMGSHRPPSTTIVVASLVDSKLLIEIDCVAIIPEAEARSF